MCSKDVYTNLSAGRREIFCLKSLGMPALRLAVPILYLMIQEHVVENPLPVLLITVNTSNSSDCCMKLSFCYLDTRFVSVLYSFSRYLVFL